MSSLEPMAKIEYLIDISKKAAGLPDALKNEDSKVYGCASETWLVVTEEAGLIFIRPDSEAAIVKGLLVLLQRVINGQTKEDISGMDGQTVLDTIGLGGSLSNRRMNGFASAIEKVQRQVEQWLVQEAD